MEHIKNVGSGNPEHWVIRQIIMPNNNMDKAKQILHGISAGIWHLYAK